MDGLSFSNSLTVEQNILGPGVIAHILRSRMKVMGTIDPGTFDETDLYFHYDQVGSVMMASNSAGSLQTTHHQDAWGNVMSDWQTGHWANASGQAGWHHNTLRIDGEIGLYYMQQRWYSSLAGTFVSPAPMQVQYEHSYAFSESGPTYRIDPEGKFSTRGCGSGCPLLVPFKGKLDPDLDSLNSDRDLLENLIASYALPDAHANCLRKQLDNATVNCRTDDLCSNDKILGFTMLGSLGNPTGDITVCLENHIQDANQPVSRRRNIADTILHEIAHTCGMSGETYSGTAEWPWGGSGLP